MTEVKCYCGTQRFTGQANYQMRGNEYKDLQMSARVSACTGVLVIHIELIKM